MLLLYRVNQDATGKSKWCKCHVQAQERSLWDPTGHSISTAGAFSSKGDVQANRCHGTWLRNIDLGEFKAFYGKVCSSLLIINCVLSIKLPFASYVFCCALFVDDYSKMTTNSYAKIVPQYSIQSVMTDRRYRKKQQRLVAWRSSLKCGPHWRNGGGPVLLRVSLAAIEFHVSVGVSLPL